MIPSQTLTFTVRRQSALGLPVVGKTATTDWLVIVNGVSASPSAVSYIGTVLDFAYYSITTTAPATSGPVQILAVDSLGFDFVDSFNGYLNANDFDTLAALIGASSGSGAVATSLTTATNFGQVVQGDAWHSGSYTVPLTTVSRWGYTDLSGMTISAGLKSVPADSSTAITAAITSAANRTVTASWDAFPAGLALTGSETSKTFTLDIQLKHTASGRIITALRGSLVVVWQTDTTV